VEDELRRQAETDPLTGLPNRRGLERGIAERRGRRPYAMIVIDVDRLKSVNDRLGHAAGDALLTKVAGAARQVLRTGDVIARAGGDEFAVFVADATPGDAEAVVGRLHGAIRALDIEGASASASIGYAVGKAGDDPEATLREADAAMYREKEHRPAAQGLPAPGV
jgi:diguanylate cyclase (GGDEF)-like protein